MSTLPEALAGTRIVEFGGYAAGPHIGKILANYGATVVHVESRSRPDGFRLQYPPFTNGKQGVNRGGCFSLFNDSKFGVTVDVKKPAGLELAKRLTDWSDIVVENMRPGVMERIGLGYSEISKSNPGLIMLSTCNMGQTGPRADTPGFGSMLSAFAGFCGLTGEPDGPPMLLYGPYIDFIASNFGAAAVLAALDRKRRSGRGAYIDQSQYESGLLFLAGALLDHHDTGHVAQRAGNHDPEAVPHGSYRCRDNQWLVLSCWSDHQFRILTTLMGQPELADDGRFSTAKERHRHQQALDETVQAWTENQVAQDLAVRLQEAGVPSYPVNTMADLFSDPQLLASRHWRVRQHAEMGEQAYQLPPFDLSETPGDIKAAAPLLGAHNEIVFKDFVGLSEQEYRTYAEAGVFD